MSAISGLPSSRGIEALDLERRVPAGRSSSSQTIPHTVPILNLSALCLPNIRCQFSLEQANSLITKNQKEWVFEGKDFSKESESVLAKHLQTKGCRVESVKLINCLLDDKVFEEFFQGLQNNTSVQKLHIESCIIGRKLGSCIGETLKKGAYRLQTLNFVKVIVHPDAFRRICSGLQSQNDLLQIAINKVVEELDISDGWKEDANQLQSVFKQVAIQCGIKWEGNSLSIGDVFSVSSKKLTLFQTMKTLFEKQVGVSTLCIEGSKIGPSNAEELKNLLVGTQKLKVLNLQANKLGGSMVLGGESLGIKPIVQGLLENTSIVNLVLSSNDLTNADCHELTKAVYLNPNIIINLTGNVTETIDGHPQLIFAGSTPCSQAVSNTPRKSSVTTHSPSSSLRRITSISSENLK